VTTDVYARSNPWAEVWRVAFPLILSMGSQSLMLFFDRLFLGWHDEVSLRAALSAGILAFTMQSGFFALAGYSNTFVAQYHGAGDRAGCAKSVAQALWLAVIAWPLVVALIPLNTFILRISAHGADVFAQQTVYGRILLWGSLPSLVSSAAAGFFSGRGDTRTTMWAYLIGNAANIALDYWFIFGGLGLPAMGIRGAAYATVIAGFVPVAIFLARLYGPRLNALYRTRARAGIDGPLMRRMLRFGAPAGVQLLLDLTAFAVFVLVTGRFGALEQSANSIALSINALSFLPVIAFGVTAGIVAGQHLGRRDPDAAARGIRICLVMGIVYMGALGLSFILFPRAYIGLFAGLNEASVKFDKVYPVARALLGWVAAWSVGDAIVLVMAGALKGAGDTRFVMWYSIVCNWGLFVGGVLAAVFLFDAGFHGAWFWTVIFVWIMAAGYLLRYRSGRWKDIDLLGRRTMEPLPPPAQHASDAMVTEG
jgi:multidrug resistance protein, MATE family